MNCSRDAVRVLGSEASPPSFEVQATSSSQNSVPIARRGSQNLQSSSVKAETFSQSTVPVVTFERQSKDFCSQQRAVYEEQSLAAGNL